MTMISLGDLAQNYILSRKSAASRHEIQSLTKEVTTGQTADIVRATRAHLGPVMGIDASLTQLDALKVGVSETGQILAAMQTSINLLDQMSADLSGALLAAVGSNTPTRLNAVAEQADEALSSAISALNLRYADRSVFAGNAFQSPAVESADDLLNRLMPQIVGLTTADQVIQAVETWFASPTGYANLSYGGGAAVGEVPVSADQRVNVDVTAQDPALVATLGKLALGAMLDRGALATNPSERTELARRVATGLLETQTDRALLAAHIGVLEGRVESARVQNEAERTSLGLARSAITGVDDYEAASRLEQAQGQLEKIYAITARMSRLSLLEFLR
jgi:flagellar hook-associated protein 3 FlgL